MEKSYNLNSNLTQKWAKDLNRYSKEDKWLTVWQRCSILFIRDGFNFTQIKFTVRYHHTNRKANENSNNIRY